MKLNKLGLILFFIISTSQAQELLTAAGSDANDLAKQLQNPIANLISVPFKGDFDFGIGPENGSRYAFRIQPIVPTSISENWNLVTRVILPIITQSNVFGKSGSQTGLGDVIISGFLSPKSPTKSGIIWGAGPVALVPTATDDLLGSKKFGVGPTAVVLTQIGEVSAGFLTNHIWSVAGDSDRDDINNTFFQPFVGLNFSGGYGINLGTEITQNWDNNTTYGVITIGGSRVVNIGSQAVQFTLGPRFFYGSGSTEDFGVNASVVLMFPK